MLSSNWVHTLFTRWRDTPRRLATTAWRNPWTNTSSTILESSSDSLACFFAFTMTAPGTLPYAAQTEAKCMCRSGRRGAFTPILSI